MSDTRERQLVENLERENAEMRADLFARDRLAFNTKLKDDMALVQAREQRQAAERQTEELRIREETRRGLWSEVAITSQIGSDMTDEEVFQPERIRRFVDEKAATGTWPGGADQERAHEFLWQHLQPATDRHASLGDDDLSPMEKRLADMLK
jgi:hypothetical protein